MINLDFGSGYNPERGYLTCDYTGLPNLDFIFDKNQYKIIGVKGKYFDSIRCCNVIHHIPNLRKLFIEFQRVLKIGGNLVIIEPNKEHYQINCILDIIWYRFVTPRYDVWFSNKYRDYTNLLKRLNFKELGYVKKNEKESYHFRRLC